MNFSLFDIFDDLPVINVVDIGASPIDGEPPYQQLINQNQARVIGFEPNPDQFNQLLSQESTHCHFLPYAIGDGESHVLNICQAPGMSSLLVPDLDILRHFHGFEQWARIIEQQPVSTSKLDDIVEIQGKMDYLKMDVQGSELSIIENGLNQLAKTVVIHTEIQFVPFYQSQPLFGDLDQALVRAGFYLHRFTPLVSRIFKPLVNNGDIYAGLSQILWTDAIYVRRFTDFPQLDPQELLKIAVISHDIYGSYDLCALALDHVDRKEKTQRQSSYIQKLVNQS